MAGILDGVRVLDFGRHIAGPWCAALLGDLGADVIRIEKREGSEDRWLLPVAEGGDGALFLAINRNKRGVALDPMAPRGREIVRRLVATADVVVANLPPQTLTEMGLDYPSLCATRPDVILTRVSAFGRGPYSERVGFDGIGQAMCGAMYLSGTGELPMKSYVPFVDFTTAHLAAFGTLAALWHRRETGRGQEVEGSLLASSLVLASSTLVEQALAQPNRVATGNRSQLAGPSDAFRTRDGWILVQVVGNPLFRRWARLLGEDEWLSDPRFADDASRGRHGEALSARMAEWCEKRSAAEALAELERARIPAGPVYSPQQALDDPHVRASGLLTPVEFPGLAEPAPINTTPVRLSETPGAIRLRPPLLGEHTDLVLREVGYSPEEIAALRADGVVG